MNRVREFLRGDAEDGWVAYMPGEIPVLVAIPVLFLTGLACVIGGLAWLTLSPSHWWKAAMICALGAIFLWMSVQFTIGWRRRRAKRRR